jgi:hypothetical protein
MLTMVKVVAGRRAGLKPAHNVLNLLLGVVKETHQNLLSNKKARRAELSTRLATTKNFLTVTCRLD